MATPDVLQALGRLYARQGRFVESRAVLERAAASSVTVPLLIDLARAAVQGRRREGALGYLAHARIARAGQRGRALHVRDHLRRAESVGAEAYESMKKAMALDPDNPQINYVLGAVATHRPDRSEAIPYFEKYVAPHAGRSAGRLCARRRMVL